MLVLTIATLTALALLNYLSCKSFFYPPVVFCGSWAVWLTLVLLADRSLYPLSEETLAIFSLGSLAFSLGGAAFSWLSVRPCKHPALLHSKLLSRSIIVCALLFPLYCYWIYQMVEEYPATTFLGSARAAFLAYAGGKEYALSSLLFINLPVVVPVIALITVCDRNSSKRLKAFMVILAILVGILSGAKGVPISFILSLICVDWLKKRRIQWKLVLTLSLVVVIVFITIALTVNTADLVSAMMIYSVGGIIGFDHAVQHPGPAHESIYDFPVHWLNNFGAHIRTPSPPASTFVDIGPDLQGNVFTIYMPYAELGIAGIAGIMLALGAGLSWLYRRALVGHPIAIVMYGICFAGLMQSAFSEQFFMHANNLLKCFCICWLAYRPLNSLPNNLGRLDSSSELRSR